MQTFPSFWKLSGRPVLVVGGGENAARKIHLLLKADAAVTVSASELNSEIAGLAGQGRIAHRAGPFSPALLDGMRLVISAAGGALDEEVAAAAQARGIFVNVVDRADLSDFLVPAIVERGDITVGIASNGTAPLLLGRIRAQIEALLPARLGELGGLAGEFRTTVARIIPDAKQRKAFWERIFDGPVAAKALSGDRAAARSTLLAELNGPQEQAPQGIVYLVGAGPGDPELLTLAALRVLRDADIILHDDLVATAILDRARRDAERVSVGKRKGRHSASQAEINALMAAHAALGRRVVRLKAGDPFVFGRGGEEVEYLEARGIAVAVVPGITAALGCAASAGIPLTHRDLSHGVTLVSGQLKDGEEPLNWAGRAAQGETVVVYMGLAQARAIRDRLLSQGVSPSLPVALIENGTRPDQLVSSGQLGDLPALAARHGTGPVLMVIGKVAAKARATATETQRRRA